MTTAASPSWSAARRGYRAVLTLEPGAAPPNMEPGPLVGAWARWRTEGLRPDLDPHDYDAWCEAFGWDPWPRQFSLERPKAPLYEEAVVAEDATTVTRRLSDGSVIRDGKGAGKSIYQTVKPAVATEEDWRRLKAWLDVDAPPAASGDPWAEAVFARARACPLPMSLSAGSLLGMPRNWLGFEEFAVRQIEDPDALEDMVETCCRAAEWRIRSFGENGVAVDVVHFWEDICYKNGPMVTPDFFGRVARPRYRRIADLCRRYGYPALSVDSDGDISALLEGWLAGGVNHLNPLEAQAGMDVNDIQRRCGRRASLAGGIHKYRLAEGEKAIAGELRRVRPAVENGGYIPMLDHNVPADVPLAHYLVYCRLKREILGIGRPFDPSRALA